MSKKRYTDEQIKELKANKYVMNCTEKSIQFTDEFRKIAMKLDGKEFPRAIFKKCWFPDYIVNSIIPEKSFNRRRKSMREKWEIWLIDNRWRNWWKPRKNKIKKKSWETIEISKEEWEYMQAELAVYKELFWNNIGWYP